MIWISWQEVKIRARMCISPLVLAVLVYLDGRTLPYTYEGLLCILTSVSARDEV